MKRQLASVFLCGALGLASCSERSAAAQAPASLPKGLWSDDVKETEALALDNEGKLLTARRLADEILAKNPDSIVGHFVVGHVLYEEEGSLPNSLFHLKRALALYNEKYPTDPAGPSSPWRLHSKILLNINWVANDMEDYDEQFWAIDEYNKYYTPKRDIEKAWPLMKQKKFAEARAVAEEGRKSTVEWQSAEAANALCAISGEERDRQKGYTDCLAAYEKTKVRAKRDPGDLGFASDIVVDGYNAAWGALGLLKFEDTERLLTEATQSWARTGTNPWQSLAELYTEQGRPTEAISALQEMLDWKKQSPPSTRDQRRAGLEQTLAYTLLAVGEARLGFRVITRALEHPDRRANTSSDAAQALGGTALLRRAMGLSLAELYDEDASAKGTFKGALDRVRAQDQRALAAIDAERVLGVLTEQDRLISTFRLYLAGGLDTSAWLTSDVISIVGPGIADVVIQQIRAQEMLEGLAPYYDSFDAEIAFLQGDPTQALALAQKALASLPPKQKLIRARTAAIGAESAWQLGDTATAIELFTQAMQQDPGTIRRLRLALPAKIQDESQSELSKEIAGRLGSSPRLRESEDGFLVSIRDTATSVEICVESMSGVRLGCATTPPPTEEDEKLDEAAKQERTIVSTIQNFHQKLFSPVLGDAMADLRSLDGSPATASDAMRDKTRSILEEMSE